MSHIGMSAYRLVKTSSRIDANAESRSYYLPLTLLVVNTACSVWAFATSTRQCKKDIVSVANRAFLAY